MYSRVVKSCPSKLINAWKVSINERHFIISPAHVCVYPNKKNRLWVRSEFLDELKDRAWKVPSAYSLKPRPFVDLAWTEIEPDVDSIPIGRGIRAPQKVEVFFRQPLTWDGKWNSAGSTMGSTEAVLYPTPKILGGENSEDLLEAVDIGFRGMSGALATYEGRCEGIFVKRGSLREMKKPDEPSQEISSQVEPSQAISSELPPGVTGSPDVKIYTLHITIPEYSAVQRGIRSLLGLDRMEGHFMEMEEGLKKMEERLGARLNKMEDRFQTTERALEYLKKNGLTKQDLHELAVVIDARRGIFLPANVIEKIIRTSDACPLGDLVGKLAPEIENQ